MALSVQTNNAAMTALKHLNTNNTAMNKSLERLSSGFRVNNAADDASGYAVSSKLDAQTQRLKAASLNATQAQAMTKMADAGVNEIQNMVVRIQTLATQASSANNAGELGKLDAERIKLESAIDKIANGSNYNGVNLLNGKDAASALVAGTAATLAGATLQAVGATAVGLVTTGAPTFAEAATFTVVQSTAGLITSITADVALTNAATGAAIGGAAGTNLITAQSAVGAITVGGMIFTSAAATTTAPATTTTSTTAAATAGTAATAAGQSAYAAALAFQVGADNTVNNQVSVDLTASYATTALGLGSGDLLTQANAQAYIDTAKAALDTIVTQRADLGATQNQVAFVQSNLATSIEQTTAAVSSIRDADMASEMAAFTKNQILTQASTSMLAQANQAAQNVMTLFR
ncbi:MAG: flagellar protein [Zetaproteobacteria bacterium CG2_30_46_52]|nr:MAG: flagellar protein [Zetaproteobacteria bacterium CG2_30_46_52]